MARQTKSTQPPGRGIFDPDRVIKCPVHPCRNPNVATEGMGDSVVKKRMRDHIQKVHPGWNGRS